MIVATAVALAVLIPSAHAQAVKNLYDPEYYANEWTGVCASGEMQTPIDLPLDAGTLPGVPEDLVTDIMMPVINAPVTNNVGSAMQITWDPMSAFDMKDDSIFPMVAAGGDKISDVILNDAPAEYMLKMIPLQIHWHDTSEHSIGGLLAPMEAHIVTAVGPGEAPPDWGCDAVWEGGEAELEKCIAVFGIMYRFREGVDSPDYLDKLLDSFPSIAGSEAPYPDSTFDLASVLPDDLSYDSYIGSLTTPPCAEGLRWHVFTNYIPVSIDTVTRFEEVMVNITDRETGDRQLYRHNNRPIQLLNDRNIYHHTASSDEEERVRRPRGGK